MADTPLFYFPQSLPPTGELSLPDDTARHVAQVLRMVAGEEVLLTDGKGVLATCRLDKVEKKRVSVVVQHVDNIPPQAPSLHLAIAFTKSAARNEWLLEKATELGVRHISPIITARSIRERIRLERWHAILISAMLQSKQCWLPQLDAPIPFTEIITGDAPTQKLIAHCMNDVTTLQRMPITQALAAVKDTLILIGPEGDFTSAEVTLALAAGASPISLGGNRLRTETAALAAISYFYLINHVA